MRRRSFLIAMAGLFGGSTLARTPFRRQPIPIHESPLAGFQYHSGEDVWPDLDVGDVLELVREPANPYDRRAVRVDWRGAKLGYVPRSDNGAVVQMLDRGRKVTARIARLRDDEEPWRRVRIEIRVAI